MRWTQTLETSLYIYTFIYIIDLLWIFFLHSRSWHWNIKTCEETLEWTVTFDIFLFYNFTCTMCLCREFLCRQLWIFYLYSNFRPSMVYNVWYPSYECTCFVIWFKCFEVMISNADNCEYSTYILYFFQPHKDLEVAIRLTTEKEGTTQTNIIQESVRSL